MNGLNKALTTGAVAFALVAAAGVQAQDEGGVTRYGPETFAGDELEVDGFAGTIEIVVEDRVGIEVSAVGPADKMELLEVDGDDDLVELSLEEQKFRWGDWNTWFSWWGDTDFDAADYPVVTVRLPSGTPVEVDGLTGIFNAGDLNGPLEFSGAGAIEAAVGNLSSAIFDIAGAADISLGDVAGPLEIEVAGAAEIDGGSAQSVEISLRGASDVTLGVIAQGADISIAGAGDVELDSINGNFDVSIAGAGDVTVNGGRAERFDVSIAGTGDVTFRGTAVNPRVSIAGMGDVYIERYEGSLSHSGMGDVNIGSGS